MTAQTITAGSAEAGMLATDISLWCVACWIRISLLPVVAGQSLPVKCDASPQIPGKKGNTNRTVSPTPAGAGLAGLAGHRSPGTAQGGIQAPPTSA